MTDLEALYQSILESPGDDTPRLAYADALEEAGQLERCEFVRTQVKLSTMGPPRLVIDGDEMPIPRGPRCWEVGSDMRYFDTKVGDRIDILNATSTRGKKKYPPLLGLRVSKMIDDEDDHTRIILVEDAESGPDQSVEIRARERELLSGGGATLGAKPNWGEWCQPVWDLGIILGYIWHERITYTRGFLSRVRLNLTDLLRHASALLAAHPIERFEVTDVPGLTLWVREPQAAIQCVRCRDGFFDNGEQACEYCQGSGLTRPPLGWRIDGVLEITPSQRNLTSTQDYRSPSAGVRTRSEMVSDANEWVRGIVTRLRDQAGDNWPGPSNYNYASAIEAGHITYH